MWTPLCAESKLINKSLLTIALITFFFNPTVDIAFIGEKLMPAIGKGGGSGHNLTVQIFGRQIPHVYIFNLTLLEHSKWSNLCNHSSYINSEA